MALPSFLLLNGTTAVDGLITRAKRTSTKEVKGEVSPKVRQVFHLNGTGGKANLNQDKLSFSQELVNRIGAIECTFTILPYLGTTKEIFLRKRVIEED